MTLPSLGHEHGGSCLSVGIDISISLSPMERWISSPVSYTETSSNIELVSIYQGFKKSYERVNFSAGDAA
jgi:hypothetical protein